MPAAIIHQLQSEIATWKRLLSFLMEENIHLKNRIAEILRADAGTGLLAELERFQTSFIHTDTLVTLLRNDVADFETKFEMEGENEQLINKNITSRLQRMRRNMNAAGRTFDQRQTAFNNYFSENM